MEPRVTKAARVSARFSKSLARRRLRPNQEKVRSPTQRRGKPTNPFISSLLLTTPMRSRDPFAPAVSLPGVVAAIGPDQFEPWEPPTDLVEHQTGPVAVWDGGG